MAQRCPQMAGCELYPLFGLRKALRVWQMSYCESDYHRCVRYVRMISGERVPASLLPNGKTLFGDIDREHR